MSGAVVAIIVIILILLLAGLGVAIYFYFRDKNKNQPTPLQPGPTGPTGPFQPLQPPSGQTGPPGGTGPIDPGPIINPPGQTGTSPPGGQTGTEPGPIINPPNPFPPSPNPSTGTFRPVNNPDYLLGFSFTGVGSGKIVETLNSQVYEKGTNCSNFNWSLGTFEGVNNILSIVDPNGTTFLLQAEPQSQNSNTYNLNLVVTPSRGVGDVNVFNWTYDPITRFICGTGTNSNVCLYSEAPSNNIGQVLGLKVGAVEQPRTDPGYQWETGPIVSPPACVA